MLRFLRRLVAASSFSNQKKVLIQPSSLLQKHQWSKHHNNVTSSEVATHVLVIKSPIRKVAPLAGAAAAGGAGGAAGGAGLLSRVGSWFGGMMGRGAATKPAAGSATTTLQPTNVTTGTSMTSNSSARGVANATPVKVQQSQPAQGGNIFDDAVRESQMGDLSPTDSGPSWKEGQEQFNITSTPARGDTSPSGTTYRDIPKNENPTQTTENTSQPTLDEVVEPIEAKQAANAERAEDAKTKRSARNTKVVAYGYPAAQMAMGMRGNAQAKQQAEMERIQGLAEDGKANSTTGGGKVAVTA